MLTQAAMRGPDLCGLAETKDLMIPNYCAMCLREVVPLRFARAAAKSTTE